MILHGDCLVEMKKIDSESIDLVYLDPPFYTQKRHTLKARDNEAFSFDDRWDSLDDYLQYIKERLVECRRVLKGTGTIFLHCDKNASYRLRTILDDVFGVDNFRNEIIWTYKRWTNSKNSLQSCHQSIYFYSKSDSYKFNTIYTDYAASTNVDQILQERQKNEHGKSIYKKDENGSVIFGKEKRGVPLGDVWYIPYLNPKATERVGYPTQKPVLLLERIIEIATDENDIVLDPFCGSGTTLVAACLQRRQFIGIDKSIDAVKISTDRVNNPQKTVSHLLEKGEGEYMNKSDSEIYVLKCLDAVPVQRNSGIDGFLKTEHYGTMIPVKIQKPDETLLQAKQKLLNAASKRNCSQMVVVRTHDDKYEQTRMEKQYTDTSNVFIVDSYELSVESWLSGLEHVYQIAVSE